LWWNLCSWDWDILWSLSKWGGGERERERESERHERTVEAQAKREVTGKVRRFIWNGEWSWLLGFQVTPDRPSDECRPTCDVRLNMLEVWEARLQLNIKNV
jgi:hypothetical protein